MWMCKCIQVEAICKKLEKRRRTMWLKGNTTHSVSHTFDLNRSLAWQFISFCDCFFSAPLKNFISKHSNVLCATFLVKIFVAAVALVKSKGKNYLKMFKWHRKSMKHILLDPFFHSVWARWRWFRSPSRHFFSPKIKHLFWYLAQYVYAQVFCTPSIMKHENWKTILQCNWNFNLNMNLVGGFFYCINKLHTGPIVVFYIWPQIGYDTPNWPVKKCTSAHENQ